MVKITSIDGVIASNTSIARDKLISENKKEMGGLSGKPITDKSTKRWLVHTSEEEVTLEQIEKEYDMYSKSLRWQLIENNILENFDVKVSAEEVEGHTRSLIAMQMGQYGQPVPEEDKMNEIVANVLMKEDERKKVYDQLKDCTKLVKYS